MTACSKKQMWWRLKPLPITRSGVQVDFAVVSNRREHACGKPQQMNSPVYGTECHGSHHSNIPARSGAGYSTIDDKSGCGGKGATPPGPAPIVLWVMTPNAAFIFMHTCGTSEPVFRRTCIYYILPALKDLAPAVISWTFDTAEPG